MASAGPHASLHLAPDRQPRQHPTTQFFTGRMPFLLPNQQRQSTEGRLEVTKTITNVGKIKNNKEKGCGKMCDTVTVVSAPHSVVHYK